MAISKSQKKGIRIVVADDNKQMRDKVVQLLDPEYEVVGSAADGKAALEIVKLLKPDIAVLDISMPILSGIEVAAEIERNGSDVKVVFLTVHSDPDYVKAALNVGASGYVVKSQMAEDLSIALSESCNDGIFISPDCEVRKELNKTIS